jgi:hypothetical protein
VVAKAIAHRNVFTVVLVFFAVIACALANLARRSYILLSRRENERIAALSFSIRRTTFISISSNKRILAWGSVTRTIV